MDSSYIDALTRRFPRLSRLEIQQTALLSELRTDDKKLAWRMTTFALRNMMRLQRRYDALFMSYQDCARMTAGMADGADDEREVSGDGGSWLAGPDEIFESWLMEEEWAHITAGLPTLARKLAEIAKQQADSFEDVRGGVWTRDNLAELRRRIKREFLAWSPGDKFRNYDKAKNTIVEFLKRHNAASRGTSRSRRKRR